MLLKVVSRVIGRVGVVGGWVVANGPAITPSAAAEPVLLTTYRLPAASKAMSPFVPAVPVDPPCGSVELATTPIAVFVVVFQPKTVRALTGALARLAQ